MVTDLLGLTIFFTPNNDLKDNMINAQWSIKPLKEASFQLLNRLLQNHTSAETKFMYLK